LQDLSAFIYKYYHSLLICRKWYDFFTSCQPEMRAFDPRFLQSYKEIEYQLSMTSFLRYKLVEFCVLLSRIR